MNIFISRLRIGRLYLMYISIDLESATVNTVEAPRSDGAENLCLGYMNYVRDSTRDNYMEQSYYCTVVQVHVF